ncbi:MAG: hypothetical protein GX060_01810 [Firmicutes bacterium]|nr:hypothetical protein [Bacillota bacterium]
MWQRNLLIGFLILVCLTLQTTWIPQLGALLSQTDLIFALTAAFALLSGPTEGAIFGAIVGLLRGILLGPALGIYAVPLYILGYAVGHFSRIVNHDSILVPLAVGSLATIAYWLMLTALTGGFYGFWISGHFWLALPGMLIANSFMTLFIYSLFRRFDKRLRDGGRR